MTAGGKIGDIEAGGDGGSSVESKCCKAAPSVPRRRRDDEADESAVSRGLRLVISTVVVTLFLDADDKWFRVAEVNIGLLRLAENIFRVAEMFRVADLLTTAMRSSSAVAIGIMAGESVAAGSAAGPVAGLLLDVPDESDIFLNLPWCCNF